LDGDAAAAFSLSFLGSVSRYCATSISIADLSGMNLSPCSGNRAARIGQANHRTPYAHARAHRTFLTLGEGAGDSRSTWPMGCAIPCSATACRAGIRPPEEAAVAPPPPCGSSPMRGSRCLRPWLEATEQQEARSNKQRYYTNRNRRRSNGTTQIKRKLKW
jgi:hypothetical protein